MNYQFKNKTVKIRKEHVCFYCCRKSPVGSEMNHWAGVYDGDFYSGYSCGTCELIIDVWGVYDDDGYPEGEVKENLEPNQTPEQLLETLTT